MLTPLFIAYLAALKQDAAPPTTAAGLISRMLARYASAQSVSATIRTTQSAGPASVSTDTSLTYQRPSKIRLNQHQKSSSIDKSRMLVSDGERFAYTPPERVLYSSPYLLELVKPEGRDAQTVGDLYSVVAADLPDRSPVLDVLIARKDDLRYFANQLARFSLTGKEMIDGKEANIVEGDWRESDSVNVSGHFRMAITSQGDLLRYVLTQTFAAPSTGSAVANAIAGDERVNVTTTWDVRTEVDGTIKPESFALRAGG